MLRGILPYVIGALALLAVAGGGAAWWMSQRLEASKAKVARLEQDIMVIRAERDQAMESRRVARAEADRQRKRAEEFDQMREDLMKGTEDAPIPDWLSAYLDRLFAD